MGASTSTSPRSAAALQAAADRSTEISRKFPLKAVEEFGREQLQLEGLLADGTGQMPLDTLGSDPFGGLTRPAAGGAVARAGHSKKPDSKAV